MGHQQKAGSHVEKINGQWQTSAGPLIAKYEEYEAFEADALMLFENTIHVWGRDSDVGRRTFAAKTEFAKCYKAEQDATRDADRAKLRAWGGDKYRILPFSGDISYRLFYGVAEIFLTPFKIPL